MYGIKHRIECPDFSNRTKKAQPCQVDILTITNKNIKGVDKKVCAGGLVSFDSMFSWLVKSVIPMANQWFPKKKR